MQVPGTAEGYFGIGKQTAWGTSVPPVKFSYYKAVNPNYKIVSTPVREGGNSFDNIWAFRKSADFVGSFDVYARPDSAAAFLAYYFGSDVITGTSDPYLHTIEPSTVDVPVSIEAEYKTLDVVRFHDALISSAALQSSSGGPVELKMTWDACNIEFPSIATAAYETDNPYVFWDAAFEVDGSPVVGEIHNFAITCKDKLFTNVRTSHPYKDVVKAANRMITVKFKMFLYTKDMFRKVLTGSIAGTTVGNLPSLGSFKVSLALEGVTPARSLIVTIPNIVYEASEPSAQSADNKPLELDVAATAILPDSGSIIKVEASNGEAAAYI